MKPTENELFLFSLSDLKCLFLRHRKQIQSVALACSLCVFCLLLLRPSHYQIDASFYQPGRQGEVPAGLKEIFEKMMPFAPLPSEKGIVAVVQSNEVIKSAVEALGMQVICNPDFFITTLAKRIRNHMYAEVGAHIPDSDKFRFSDVSYSGEKHLTLFISLKEDGTYQLFDAKKQLLGTSSIGQSLSFPTGRLTLSAYPKDAKLDKFYPLSIKPLVSTIKKVRSKLRFAPNRADKSILQLAFICDDRHMGAKFLNELMMSYQNYLRKENDQDCVQQLHYLGKRRDELMSYYDAALQEHTAYLKENLAKNGCIGFEQEIATLSEPKNFYTSKLFDVDLELMRLADAKETQTREAAREDSSELLVREQIEQLDQQLKEASLLLQCAEKGGKIPSTPSLLKEPRSAIAHLVKQIAAASDLVERDPSQITFLRETIGQMEQKRKALEEDMKLRLSGSDEFSGLNLSTAQALLVEYTRQRDSLQAQMREHIFLKEQLGRPGFEMSSLGGVFDDAVIRDLVSRAGTIALQLEDENNRSQREQERLTETLQNQKNFLSHYLFQTVELKKLRLRLLSDKIASLQRAAYSLLVSEKELLNHKLMELNGTMGDLPEKWRRESLLKLKKEIGAAMLEGVSQFIERKVLMQHTFELASKSLDKAIPPVKPNPPRLLLFTLLSALLSGLACYGLTVCKALRRGFSVSEETLKLLGFCVSGKLSRYCCSPLLEIQDNDLETLRHVASVLTSRPKSSVGTTAVCIGGKHVDYTRPLAELLAMRDLKVIVVRCIFDKTIHRDEVPGLWQYLEGQVSELPIKREGVYDLITSGGTTRHSAEILASSKFQRLLSELKARYDLVLLYCSADPTKVEGTSLLHIADAAIITVQQETKEEVEIYDAWGKQQGVGSATFIYAEEFPIR